MDRYLRRSHRNWFTLMVGSMGTTTYDAAEMLRPTANKLWEGVKVKDHDGMYLLSIARLCS